MEKSDSIDKCVISNFVLKERITKPSFDEQNLSIYAENAENSDFIINIAKGFIKECFNIYNCKQWEEYPLYNEKQSMSALIPAIYKLCGFVWLEQLIEEEKKKRYIDLGTEYQKSIYFFEIKFDFINAKTNIFTQGCCDKWNTTLDQIKDITYEKCKKYFGDRDFYRVAFMILPARQKSERDKLCDNYSNELLQKIPNNCEKPNVIISYKLDTKFNPENYKYIYTHVNFIIKIEKIQA